MPPATTARPQQLPPSRAGGQALRQRGHREARRLPGFPSATRPGFTSASRGWRQQAGGADEPPAPPDPPLSAAGRP